MAKHTALDKALRQMAEGSQSAFHTFYLGSSQYIYNSALLLYGSHGDACRFMVDFYQYLYLHLPEYKRSENLEHWISRQLLTRYEQLSIGKNMPKPSVEQQMHSAAVQLPKSEQERIWRMLNADIHFPKETVRRSPARILLVISLLLLLLLVASRYAPAVAERLNTFRNTPDSEDATDGENETPENDETDDELDAIQEKLNALVNERSGSDGEAADDDTDTFTQQQQTNTPSEPDAPQTPDEPQKPQEPQEPDEPTFSEDTRSSIEDLENLELELRYGDSLLY